MVLSECFYCCSVSIPLHIRVCQIVVSDRLVSVPLARQQPTAIPILEWPVLFCFFLFKCVCVYMYVTFFSLKAEFIPQRPFFCPPNKLIWDETMYEHAHLRQVNGIWLWNERFPLLSLLTAYFIRVFFLVFDTLAAQFSMNERGCACAKPCWIL